MILAGSCANAFTLKSGAINGRTNLRPSTDCQLQTFPQASGWFNAVVTVNGEQVYGFTVTSQTTNAVQRQSELDEAQIAGRLLRSGDRALFISVSNNELTSITYKGLSERSGKEFSFKCNF
jgi:hypothetical protein